jgi:hypothetical protein
VAYLKASPSRIQRRQYGHELRFNKWNCSRGICYCNEPTGWAECCGAAGLAIRAQTPCSMRVKDRRSNRRLRC